MMTSNCCTPIDTKPSRSDSPYCRAGPSGQPEFIGSTGREGVVQIPAELLQDQATTRTRTAKWFRLPGTSPLSATILAGVTRTSRSETLDKIGVGLI